MKKKMSDDIHKTHFQVTKDMPWKKKEEWDKLLERLHKMQNLTESLFATLDFYGLLFKCPKCGTYHSADHRCFNCGFDHTAQG